MLGAHSQLGQPLPQPSIKFGRAGVAVGRLHIGVAALDVFVGHPPYRPGAQAELDQRLTLLGWIGLLGRRLRGATRTPTDAMPGGRTCVVQIDTWAAV